MCLNSVRIFEVEISNLKEQHMIIEFAILFSIFQKDIKKRLASIWMASSQELMVTNQKEKLNNS